MARKNEGGRGTVETILSWISFDAAYRIFGLALIIIGLSFYFGWAILYGTWTDSGLYTITVILVVFGILSILLGAAKKDAPRGS